MQDLMMRLAKEAVTNESLIARSIQSYCEKKNKTWVDVANQLKVTEEQLAKLALCRQPQPRNFNGDIAQIAQYVHIEVDDLTEFLQPSSMFSSFKRRLLQKHTSGQKSRGNEAMIIRRAITFVIALIAVLFVSAFLFNQPVNANATLNVLTGKAIVTQTSNFGDTTNITVEAGNSITLSTQDVVEMPANSTAELFLFEGSQVDLAENTTLELTELVNNESDHQIYMTLFNGHIVNRVTKLLGVDDAYEVRTPSSAASVRGTVFSVFILNDNATKVNVTEGVVEVALGNEVAQVHAGEMVTAVTGKPLKIEASNMEIRPTVMPPLPTEQTEVPQDQDITVEATATRKPSGTANSSAATAVSPTNTPKSSTLPSNTAESPLPTNTSGTTLPPTHTPILPTASSNTPVPVVPTNTPVPVVPTNTPVPVVPTNTPVPPTEEPALVTICHKPGDKNETKQVILSDVQGHLDHGDYLGACN